MSKCGISYMLQHLTAFLKEKRSNTFFLNNLTVTCSNMLILLFNIYEMMLK